MLEHSFPKMTWRASIRQEVDGWMLKYDWALFDIGVGLGFATKEKEG
jgi:hypothetical protein